MKSFKIMISSIIDAKNFVNIANLFEYDIDLVSDRYVVDGKSIMGIFSLELSKPITARVYSEDTEEFEEKMKEFILD